MRSVALLALLASACAPAVPRLGGNLDSGTSPNVCPYLSVDTGRVAWSGVTIGERESRVLTVRNDCTGEEPLYVEAVIDGGNGLFTVDTTYAAINPGDSAQLDLGFTAPDMSSYSATLLLVSNDPAQGTVVIQLSGTAGLDADSDGFSSFDDCDDADPTVNPGAQDSWYDGVDTDCSGGSDYDQDGDGDDASAYGGSDCDDLDDSVSGQGPEVLDGEDDDCDGLIDEDFVRAGSLVVSEIFHYPVVVGDSQGEWFEVRNPGSTAIDLRGWTVSDGGADRFTVSGSLVVDAGGYVVFGVSRDTAQNGGVPVDYVYARTNFKLEGSDTILLQAGDVTVAEVTWDSDWPDAVGASLGLDPDHSSFSDARLSQYWCVATEPLPGGDKGSPGAANGDCSSIDEDGDGYSVDGGDCDDDDADVSPDASDVWNGVDDDCDGSLDAANVGDIAIGEVASSTGNTYLGAGAGLSVGDFDADGRDDVAVASIYDSGYRGTTWIISGDDVMGMSGAPDDNDDASITGSGYYNAILAPISADVTGDGRDDLVVGSYGAYGTTMIFAGGSSIGGGMDSGDAYATVSGGSYLPSTILAHLDMDGDGRAEVVYGDPGAGTNTSYYRGAVYVAEVSSGALSWSEDALMYLRGGAAQDYLGAGLAGGDLDRDGYDDLLVGAPGIDEGGSNAGAWYLVEGGASWYGEDTAADAASLRIDGDGSNDGIGRGHPVVADIDGDNRLDFAFGGSGTDDVWIFSNVGSLRADADTDDSDLTITGSSGSRFGFALAAGDVDGDGEDDLAVGAPSVASNAAFYQWWSYPGSSLGRVMWFESSTLTATGSIDSDSASVQAWGESSTRADLFGSVLATGDVTGDGTSEVFVAAPAQDSNRGTVYAIGGY